MNRKVRVCQPPNTRRASRDTPAKALAAGGSRVTVLYRNIDVDTLSADKYGNNTYLRIGPKQTGNPCRKLLMVDELPSNGYISRYERNTNVKSYVIPKRRKPPTPDLEPYDLNLALTLIEEHEKLGAQIRVPSSWQTPQR